MVQCDDSSHDGWITDPENDSLSGNVMTDKSQLSGLTCAEHVTQQESNLAMLRQQTSKKISAALTDFVASEDSATSSSVRGSRAHGRSLHSSGTCSSPPLWGGFSQGVLHKINSAHGQLQSVFLQYFARF